MNKEFKNIEEIFQQSFDGFEADVDPSVWNNVQNSINTNAGNSSISYNSTVTSGVAKATIFKIAAGVIAFVSIASATYFLTADNNDVEETIISEINIQNDIVNLEEKTVLTEKVNSLEVVPKEHKGVSVLIGSDKKTTLNEGGLNEDSPVVTTKSGDSETKDTPPVNVNQSVSDIDSESDKEKESDDEKKPKVFEEIDAKIYTSVSEGFAPLEVEFNVDGNVVSCAWDFKDGESSTQKNTFHTFNKPGKYVVILNVLDLNNRDKKITKTIIVKSNFPLSLNPITKVLSPNGDNINDELKISGENILKLEVFIMDNKGNIVHRLNSVDDVWDGKDQRSGNLVIPGTYYVSGVVVGVDGDSTIIKKSITVFK